MLFTSAGFMFLFLPVSLIAYYLIPLRFRRHALLGISVLFCLLASIRSPLAVLLLAAASVGTYFIGRTVTRWGRLQPYAPVLCVAVAALLLTLFRLLDGAWAPFIFPLGAAVWLLASVSYISDLSRGDAESGTLPDTLLYICFFPVTVVGPIIKYKQFVEYIDELQCNVDNFSYGVRMFALGVVERVAIAGVLMECFERIIEADGGNIPSMTFGLICAVLIFLGGYFAFAGWTDMGVGIAAMLGIRLQRDSRDALWAYSPTRYFSRLMVGLWSWIEDYASAPLMSITRLDTTRFARGASSALTVFLMAMWIQTSPSTLIMAVVVAVIVFVIELSGAEAMLENSVRLRPLGAFLTFVLVSVFWTAGISDGAIDFLGFINGVGNASDADSIYLANIAISGRQYLITAISAPLLALAAGKSHKILDRLSPRAAAVAEWIGTILLLLAFAFTVICYLPVYPQMAERAFAYFVF